MTLNVKKFAVVVCIEDKVNPAKFKRKWGEDDLLIVDQYTHLGGLPIVDQYTYHGELPIVDQYTYLGVEISKNCSWDAHIEKVIGKGRSQVGKMDAILSDPHLDTRTTVFIFNECDCTKVRVCKRSIRREREVRKTTRNSADDSSQKDTK